MERGFEHRGPSATLLVLPSYILLSLLFAWPLLPRFAAAILSSRVALDPVMQAFLMGWDAQSLLARPFGIFDLPIFHPEPNALAYMDHLLGETFLALPVLAISGSVAAGYNFVLLLSFATSAWGTYLLARHCGASRPGAWLAGFLFAFSPYRYANLDLLNQLQTQLLPFGILFAMRFLERYRARDLRALAGCLVAQVFFGWYYAYYLGIAILLLVAYAMFTRSFHPGRLPLKTYAVVLGGAIVAILPITLPYVRERLLLSEFRRTLGESALYSADVLDYFKLNANTLAGRLLPFATGAQSYWPGLVTVVLGVMGIRSVKTKDSADERGPGSSEWARGYFLLLTLAALVLSLGPVLHVAGATIWIPLPYAGLYFVMPGFSSMRAPARFAVLVVLGLSVLASSGWGRLRARTRERGRWPAVAALVLGVALLSAWPHNLSMVDLPSKERIEPVYAWLKTRPSSEPVLEIPVPPKDQDENETLALRQYQILFHGHSRLDGTSGFVSRKYKEFRSQIQSFPDDASLHLAQKMGAKLVIVHLGDYPEGERERLKNEIFSQRRLQPLTQFGSDAVYELLPMPL